MSVSTELPTGPHFISLNTAVTMTTRYRKDYESLAASSVQNQAVLPLSETFNRSALDALLAKTGCEGIRIYYGLDEESKVHAILVAVDENNEDILPGSNTETVQEYIVERGQRCPDVCPPASPLNS